MTLKKENANNYLNNFAITLVVTVHTKHRKENPFNLKQSTVTKGDILQET